VIDKKMKITRRTAIGVTLIVLIGLTSWGLAGTLTEQQYIDAGKAEYHRGNYESAIYLFTAGLELNPDNHYIYNDRGLCYLAVGDTDKAISDFSEAIVLEPDFAKAHYNRGLAYFKTYYTPAGYGNMKLLDNAILNHSKAIELVPNYVDAYYNRGLAYNQFFHYYGKPFSPGTIEAYNRSLADFDTVLELDPTYVLAYAGKGNAYYRYGEFDNATAEFNTALNSTYIILLKAGDPGLAGVYASRARNYKEIRQLNESIADYNNAKELNPEPMVLLAILGHQASNYQIIGEYEKAIELCNEEIALPIFQWYPYAYYAYALRGACYYELGEYNKTIADFEKVIEEYESELEAHAYMYLGMAYSEAGNETEATAAFESAIGLYNATIEAGGWVGAEAYNNRGLCYLGIEEYNSSIPDFEKVIELEPNYVDAHSGKNLYIEAHKNLGIAYSETGDKEKAREYFDEGLRLANEQGLEKTAKEIQDLLGEL
jgi:tetratricopeptide (TPR) repeat protein